MRKRERERERERERDRERGREREREGGRERHTEISWLLRPPYWIVMVTERGTLVSG